MDTQSQERLQQLLLKEFESLTEDDKAFLRARRGYLTRTQKKDYADILGEEAPQQNQPRRQAQPQLQQNRIPTQYNRNEGQKNPNQQQVNQPAPQVQTQNVVPPAVDVVDDDEECLDPDCTNPEHNHQ